MSVLGLDIATKTGWTVGTPSGEIIAGGTWNFSKKKNDHDFVRVKNFRDNLDNCKKAFPDINVVVWERVDFSRFTQAHAVHNQLLGILMLWISDLNEREEIKYFNWGVKQIKKYATNNGNAGKDLMIAHANKKWKTNFTSKDDNEVDSRWVYDMYCNAINID